MISEYLPNSVILGRTRLNTELRALDESISLMCPGDPPVVIAPGERIFDLNERQSLVYLLREGCACGYQETPSGRKQISQFLGPGEFLGVFHNDSTRYNAQAITRLTAYRFYSDQIDLLISTQRDFRHIYLQNIRLQADKAQDHLLLLGRKNAMERLASFLLDRASLHHIEDTSIGDSIVPQISLPMSRNEIANYLNLQTETVSRMFTILRSEQIISADRGKIATILDARRLEALAFGLGDAVIHSSQ